MLNAFSSIVLSPRQRIAVYDDAYDRYKNYIDQAQMPSMPPRPPTSVATDVVDASMQMIERCCQPSSRKTAT